jgi:parvulin-like peptidyl-prolyl isomerase
LSLEHFEGIVYTNLLSAKLATHLFKNKVEAYFYKHQLDYKSVVMYEVILDDEDLALEIFYSIKECKTSFFDVAHQYIQDIELRRQNGYRGIVRRQDLSAEVSAAVFAAKPPQLIKPIMTAKGIHLIFVEEIIQPQLDNQLADQIGVDLFSKWLKQEVDQINYNSSSLI